MEKADRRVKVYRLVIAILVISLIVVGLKDFMAFGGSGAMTKVQNVYELLSEGNVEILKVDEQSGLYKVLMRVKTANSDNLQEVYVTKDGSLITDKIIVTDDYKVRLEKEKAFAECLKEKGVLIFGQSTETNTLSQLNVLGNYAYKVYVDCIGTNLEVCQQLGVTEVPTIVVGNSSVTGVHTLDWFEQMTGCAMEE